MMDGSLGESFCMILNLTTQILFFLFFLGLVGPYVPIHPMVWGV